MVQVFLHDWDGNVLGEITGAKSRRLSVGLNRGASFVFDLPLLDHPLASELFENASASLSSHLETDYRIVSVYRLNPYTEDRELLFIGPVILSRDGTQDGEEPTASFTCASPYWRLNTRIANNSGNDGRVENGLSVVGPRAALAAQLINDSNDIDGNTWLRAPEEGISETDEVTITNWGGFRTISQCISDLSGEGSLNGFDWAIQPKLETDGTGLALGDFIAAPLIGSDLTSSVIFEYGIGRNNIRNAFRSRSLENLSNRISHVSSGNIPYVITESSTSSIVNAGLFESVADGDLIDSGLRQSWVQLNKVLRSKPRRLFEITPERSDLTSEAGSNPIPLIDYAQGDRVRARVFYGGRLAWDVAIRIYSIDINWSDTNEETADLGLYLE